MQPFYPLINSQNTSSKPIPNHMILVSVLSAVVLFFWNNDKPLKPSPGFLRHFDDAFVDWTQWIVYHPAEYRYCPTPLFTCCPRVTALPDHKTLLNNRSPVAAFVYASARLLAENVVQLVGCWMLPLWLLLLVFLAWLAWGRQAIVKKSRNRIYAKYQIHKWNQNYCWLFMSFVPLSILLPLLAELALGDSYHSLTGAHPQRNFVSRLFWREENGILKEPSILDLFHPIRLHEALHGYHGASPMGQSSYSRLCRQTAVSLSWWSVFIFVCCVYGIFASAIIVMRYPLRWLFPNLALHNSGKIVRTFKENCSRPKEDQTNDVCSKTVLDRKNKRAICSADFQTNLPTPEAPAKMQPDRFIDEFDKFQYPDLNYLMSKKNECQSTSTSQLKVPLTVAPKNPKPGLVDDRGPSRNKADSFPESTVKPACVNRWISARPDSSDEDVND